MSGHAHTVPKGWTRGHPLSKRGYGPRFALSQSWSIHDFDPNIVVEADDVGAITFDTEKEMLAFLKWWYTDMTIEQRQADAEAWAAAYNENEEAEQLAAHYDNLRIAAGVKLKKAREALVASAHLTPTVRTRLFLVGDADKAVKISDPLYASIELLRIEPRE